MTTNIETPVVSTLKDKMALAISGILSPFLVIPIFIFIICSAQTANLNDFITFFMISLFFSTILPFIGVYIMVKKNKITDIHVAELSQRKIPFLMTLSSILTGTIILYFMNAPREIIILGWVMLLNGLIFFLITLFWKISMHSSILAGILISLMILVDPRYGAGFALIPPLVWARIHRQRHNFYQGTIAIILSIIGTIIMFKAFGYTAGS